MQPDFAIHVSRHAGLKFENDDTFDYSHRNFSRYPEQLSLQDCDRPSAASGERKSETQLQHSSPKKLERMKCFENQQAEHDEEDLPFALSQEEQLESPRHSTYTSIPSTPRSSDKVAPFEETTSPLPQLASSILSSPAESQLSSAQTESYASESLSYADSRCLDAAASLLFPNSSLNMTTSGLPLSRNSYDSASLSATSDMGYSQLLNKAETSAKSPRSVVRAPLPVLPEDTPTSSPTEPSSPPIVPRFHQPMSMMQSQATILEGISSHTEQRLASLAGAAAKRTSTNSFEVAIEMSCGNSVMDVLGNPTLLPLWCDAVPSLIVTQCSEGSQGAAGTDREYDAEWLEATTPYLVPPPNSSCIYSLIRTVQSSFGFPTFGRVTLFVERHRNQVGLTIGTFDGGLEVFHKLRVQPLLGGKVRLTDEVRLQFEEYSTWSALQSVFLPNLGDYMNQACSSMARLRFLVESGETFGYTPPTLGDMEPLL